MKNERKQKEWLRRRRFRIAAGGPAYVAATRSAAVISDAAGRPYYTFFADLYSIWTKTDRM